MSCKDKIEQRCKKVYSACVSYEKELPDFSELDKCTSIEETTEELYTLVGKLREQINLETLELDCVEIEGDRDIRKMFQVLLNKVCQLTEDITIQEGLIITMQEQILNLQEQNCP